MPTNYTIPGAERIFELDVDDTPTSINDLIKAACDVPAEEQQVAKLPRNPAARLAQVRIYTPSADLTITDPKTGDSLGHSTTDTAKLLLGPEAGDKQLSTATTATVPVLAAYSNA